MRIVEGEAMADALFRAVHDEGRELDEARFREDLRSRKALAKVRANTVVFDGQLVTTNYGPSNLGRIIDSILKIK